MKSMIALHDEGMKPIASMISRSAGLENICVEYPKELIPADDTAIGQNILQTY